MFHKKLNNFIIFKKRNINKPIPMYNVKFNYFTPLTNEWNNSIYNYNRNKSNIFISNYKLINKLFYGYFNLKSYNLDNNVKRQWLSMKNIFISNSTIKFDTSNINISLYVFNKEKQFLLKKIQKLNKMYLGNNPYNFWKDKYLYLDNLFKYIKDKSIFSVFRFNSLLTYKLNSFVNNFYLLLGNISFNNKNTITPYTNVFYINMLKKIFLEKMKKVFLLKYYISIILFNNYKFNINNTMGLKRILSNIFNKNVNLNIINLKYLYLNNDIFANVVSKKLGDRKKNVLRVIRKAVMLNKELNINPLLSIRWKPTVQNLIYKIIYNSNKYINIKFINKNIEKFKSYDFISNKIIENHNFINYIDYKHIIGMRLESKGRLTKRLTASRSTYKSSYQGSLKNVYSSQQNLTSSLYKGYKKSNIQYSNINSKTRNGSFGLKSWINSY
jgi:hypothetical protein